MVRIIESLLFSDGMTLVGLKGLWEGDFVYVYEVIDRLLDVEIQVVLF